MYYNSYEWMSAEIQNGRPETQVMCYIENETRRALLTMSLNEAYT